MNSKYTVKFYLVGGVVITQFGVSKPDVDSLVGSLGYKGTFLLDRRLINRRNVLYVEWEEEL